MSENIAALKRPIRRFLTEDFKITEWEQLKPYYDALLKVNIEDAPTLRGWMLDRSELESCISEDLGWRYIRMTCDTTDQKNQEAYMHFVTTIQPNIAPLNNELNEKAMASPAIEALKKEEGFDIMIRGMQKALEIYRDENVPLQTKLQQLSKKFGEISGAMTVEIDGQECTMQQAGVHLQDTSREKRKLVYSAISERRLQDRSALNQLYSELISTRNEVGQNADFDNFRDYMFAAMGRFDYTPQDCFNFHESVKQEVVPLLNELASKRKAQLNVPSLKPYDKAVDPENSPALKPFKGGDDLLDKTITCFDRLDPFLGDRLRIMKAMGHLDLVSRKGKAPGGYNYPLSEIGVPFIFMNATSTLRDMVTLLHEGGHAVHSFVMRDLELNDFKHTPSEVAELASMSMELITMDHWDVYFEEEADLKRAKREHLEQIIETLPWVATIDKFQHWIYENPGHSEEERAAEWNVIFDAFSDNITDWSDLRLIKDFLWQKQLHLYEVPFYYIEYGMAQLGAIAVWKNYKQDPKKGLEAYLNALKLGYTRSIPELYKAADIQFDFSSAYIKDLIAFVKTELDKLN